jgi:hypothetical protein
VIAEISAAPKPLRFCPALPAGAVAAAEGAAGELPAA